MKSLIASVRNLYLPNRFFWALGLVLLLFVLGFLWAPLFAVGQAALITLAVLVVLDISLLYNGKVKLKAERKLPKVFSLGDENQVALYLRNDYGLVLWCTIIDELPAQFQRRDFKIERQFKAGEAEDLQYSLRPVVRGEYYFHQINVYIRSFLSLVERRLRFGEEEMLAVYPSIIQMKKYELIALSQISTLTGLKKMRRIGHSYEFDQIRNYVKGDDYRSINWKATSRRNELMVNQYEDERSQQIFSVIDKSRAMKMPFEGMSLMDYAINTSLVISNVALQKHDKAGLLTFSDKIGNTIKAEQSPYQLRRIIEALYNEKERNVEANYELLYAATRKFIKRRSLLFLYTNFESHSSAERVMRILRRINRIHLLVVVIFSNTEILDYAEESADNVQEIYHKTVAAQFVQEKQRIVQELQQYGIQTILTRPEDLSINSVNKYLELKARGLI